MKKVNMVDFAATIDLLNTCIRLGLIFNTEELVNFQYQLDIIKYRSAQAINDSHGGKYESNK